MVVVAMGLVACSHDEQPKTPTTADPAPAASAEPLVPTTPDPTTPNPASTSYSPVSPVAAATSDSSTLTNDQILEVTHTANEGEIAQARLAVSKSKDGRVQKLAAMMIHDHSDADAKGKALAAKDNLTLQPSPTSEALRADASDATTALQGEAGAGFDKGYVDTQIHEHQKVLDLIDQKLVPDVTNADVKAYLEDVRVSVAAHLEHARKVAQKMSQQAQK